MTSVKITTVGNSLGIVLPRELLQRLRVDKGDQLYLIETRDGVELVPYQPGLVTQLEELERTARAERDVLHALARPLRVGQTAQAGQAAQDGQAAPAAQVGQAAPAARLQAAPYSRSIRPAAPGPRDA